MTWMDSNTLTNIARAHGTGGTQSSDNTGESEKGEGSVSHHGNDRMNVDIDDRRGQGVPNKGKRDLKQEEFCKTKP